MLEYEAWLGRLDFQQELMGVFFGSCTKRSSASVTQQGEAGLCLGSFIDGEFRSGTVDAGNAEHSYGSNWYARSDGASYDNSTDCKDAATTKR